MSELPNDWFEEHDGQSLVLSVEKVEAEIKRLTKQLVKYEAVFDAAFGLCHGYDWNNGMAAKHFGYRRKLLSAVNAIKEVPDCEGKYMSALTDDPSK